MKCRLAIDLREGFRDTAVVVQVDGVVVCRDVVSTRTQIGLAQRVEAQVLPGRVTVAVELEGAPAHATLVVDAPATPAVTVDLRQGRLVLAATDSLPGYV